ncbi:MAG: methyl-accepting chemotaxis protein [Planctomycetota bacterium]|nr:methyl-accepting chemotaxis protein [Planctomycetota bacterium]
MKIYRIYILTHVSAALTTAVMIALFHVWFVVAWPQVLVVLTACLLAACLGAFLAARMCYFVRSLDQLVTNPAANVLWEFQDQVVGLRAHLQRNNQFAIVTLESSREISQLIQELGNEPLRNGTSTSPHTANQLRVLLSQLAKATDTNLLQMLNSTREIELSTREIAVGAEDQNEAVSRTTTYAEQMSTNIDTITGHASAARLAVLDARTASEDALKIVQQLHQGMHRIRGFVDASGRKLQALGEHSNTISTIVGTIGTISSRTDLLALNAAIESVRAGEHGRGFAFVAEEVRKLAEQAAQATQEVVGLIESIRLETQESINVIAEEQTQIETELTRVQEAATAMQQIYRISNESAERVQDITQATQQQLQLIRDLVLAVERISKVAKTSRNRAENAQWSTRALTKAAQFVDASIAPLRSPTERRTLNALIDASVTRQPTALDHGETDSTQHLELTPAGS